MKVMVINWRDIYNPEAGGAEVHIDEILQRKPKNWKVDFISATFPGCKPTNNVHGYRIIRIPNNALFNFTFKYFWNRDFRDWGYDLIIDDISKIPLTTPKYIDDTPILAIQHHIHGKSLFKQLFFPMALYVYFMERFQLKAYVKTPIVAVSKSTREELLRLHPFKRVLVSNNGIDFKALNRGYRKGAAKKPVVLYLGRLKKYKRIDHIIIAFQDVLKQVPDAQLWIAGKGDHEPYLKFVTRQLGLESSVKFLGFVSDSDKTKIFHKTAVSAIASEKEGWGISVIESNAAGVPVVGYDVEGLRDSIRDKKTGLLAKNGSISDMAAQIVKLLSDKPLRSRMATEAVKWASGFSWDKMAADFYKIAAGVLKRPRS